MEVHSWQSPGIKPNLLVVSFSFIVHILVLLLWLRCYVDQNYVVS